MKSFNHNSKANISLFYRRAVISFAGVFLLLVATLTSDPDYYFMAVSILILPLISWVIGRFSLKGLSIERKLLTGEFEGELVEITLTVHNHLAIPRALLFLSDELPDWLVPQAEGIQHISLPPAESASVSYLVEAKKRGAYRIESVIISSQDPLGLFSYNVRKKILSEILIYPLPRQFPEIDLTGSDRHGFRDLPAGAIRGSGVEPDGVREYVPGDPLRRLHWKSLARTGKLNVIEFEESRSMSVIFALDLTRNSIAGEGRQSTLEYLVSAAASLSSQALREGASLRMVTAEEEDPANQPGRGQNHLLAILAALAKVEAVDKLPLSAYIRNRVGQIAAGTALVVFTSNPDPELPDVIRSIAGRGASVHVFYAAPALFGKSYRLIDTQHERDFIEQLEAADVEVLTIHPTPDDSIQLESNWHA